MFLVEKVEEERVKNVEGLRLLIRLRV